MDKAPKGPRKTRASMVQKGRGLVTAGGNPIHRMFTVRVFTVRPNAKSVNWFKLKARQEGAQVQWHDEVRCSVRGADESIGRLSRNPAVARVEYPIATSVGFVACGGGGAEVTRRAQSLESKRGRTKVRMRENALRAKGFVAAYKADGPEMAGEPCAEPFRPEGRADGFDPVKAPQQWDTRGILAKVRMPKLGADVGTLDCVAGQR
jgi:hypothetical protein